MNVLLSKTANRFLVNFDRFGSGDEHRHLTAQVLRVTRPHMLAYDTYGAAGIIPIEIDLRDDVSDVTRSEVLIQLVRQIKEDVTFDLTIATVDHADKVLEQWHLNECRIVDCHLDELSYANSGALLIRLRFDVKSVSVNIGDQMVVMLEDSRELE